MSRTVQFHFIHIPMFVGIGLGKHYTITIPMQLQVGNGRGIVRLIDRAYLYITPQVGQLHDVSIKSRTAGRLLITPVVGLCTQLRSHRLMGFDTQLITAGYDLVAIQEGVTHQDSPFQRERLFGTNQGGFITRIDIAETTLHQLLQFVQHRLILRRIVVRHCLHVGKCQTNGLDIQPSQLILQVTNPLRFFIQFQIGTDLIVHILQSLNAFYLLLEIRSIFQLGTQVQHNVFLGCCIGSCQPVLQTINVGIQRTQLFRIFLQQGSSLILRIDIQNGEEDATHRRLLSQTHFGFETDIFLTYIINHDTVCMAQHTVVIFLATDQQRITIQVGIFPNRARSGNPVFRLQFIQPNRCSVGLDQTRIGPSTPVPIITIRSS